MTRTIVLIILLSLGCPYVYAENWEWDFVGAPYGDPNVGEIRVDPRFAYIWYVTSWNGIYITRNSGLSWEQHLSAYCGGFAVHPYIHGRIFASSDHDLYTSDNWGQHWDSLYTFPGYIESIHVSEVDGAVFVGIKWPGISPPNGVFKSTDMGNSFDLYSFGVPDSNMIIWDIEEDPDNEILYACAEISPLPDPYDPPFFRSFDGGLTWEEVSGDLPWHVLKIQVHLMTYDVYVLTESLGLYQSTDFGDTWQFMHNYFCLELLIDANDPSRFFGGNHDACMGDGGVFQSTDTGNTFWFIGLLNKTVGSLCRDYSSSKLYAACYGDGIYVGTPQPARTWYIEPDGSGDAPTIQAGIDSAAVGDTVMLANGTFTGVGNRDIDFLGKAITVLSESGNPGSCTVDCEDAARGFYIEGGDSVTRLEGITVTRGYAATGAYLSQLGGGLFCYNSSNGPAVSNCIFLRNHAEGIGGGVNAGFSGTPTFTYCQFIENSSDMSGGGFSCGWGAEVCSPTFIDCTFLRNTAVTSGGAVTGGKSDDGFAVFEYCVFSGNRSASGGGMYSSFYQVDVTHCTFSGDSAGAGTGIYCADSSPAIENTIVAYGLEGAAIFCGGTSNPSLSSCDIYGNAGGDYVGCIAGRYHTNCNFSANPLFCDADSDDFSPAALSPCLPDNNPCGVLIGASGQGCGAPAGTDPPDAKRSELLLMQNYPNPFNPRTTLTYTIPEAGMVDLRIYDVRGSLVRAVVDERKLAGTYTETWDGKNDSGTAARSCVYFVRLRAGGQERSIKIILLK